MSNLTILNTSIRTLDGLYSLNDFHKASGTKQHLRPSKFIRNDQTKDLISEIEKDQSPKMGLTYKSLRGGLNAGVWACEEIALAYAMWISPKFHLIVLRAFLAMHKAQQQPQQLALPEPEPSYSLKLTQSERNALAWLWFSHGKLLQLVHQLQPALDAIQSTYAPTANSHYIEYRRDYQTAKPIIDKLLKDENISYSNEHGLNRVLQELRPLQKPKGYGRYYK